ncbi:hypothetical protein [Polynucleobacter nymphae]|uniref:hypothetical protein n=1 Tax=Polynucleobacter nymphae TaxID=2081043 RepID=UPI001C0DC87E|nr:hypothetical protein [Polynucleobacter nymphae]MBU3608171.1 hypothetical protein [Polynucleobacter nymphae]
MSSTVLITTANKPPKDIPYLQMTNLATRYITAKAAIFFWAAHGIKKIVIADATGGTLLNDEEVVLLKQMGVDVEQISYCQNDDSIKLRGKGYGEGELIKFALKHSTFLKNENNFFKCTGKIYCRNFETIIEMIKQNNIQNIFWRHLGEGDSLQPWADMRFFYTSKKFCEEYLIPAYLKSDDRKEEAVEYFSFNIFNEKLSSAKALRPLLSGFSGGTGKQYFDLGLGMLDISYPCWVGAQ